MSREFSASAFTEQPHFQKERKPGARLSARSIMGSFGGARAFVFNFVRPQTIP